MSIIINKECFDCGRRIRPYDWGEDETEVIYCERCFRGEPEEEDERGLYYDENGRLRDTESDSSPITGEGIWTDNEVED